MANDNQEARMDTGLQGFAGRTMRSLADAERGGQSLISCPGLSIHIPPLIRVLAEYDSLKAENAALREALKVSHV